MYKYLVAWWHIKSDRRAVTALEYGLIAALIAGVVVVGVTALGVRIDGLFTNLAAKVTSSTPP